MALKMDRQVDSVEIGFYMNEAAERGNVASISTAGSGVALDTSRNVAIVSAGASGVSPLGILMSDVVSVDRTRTPLNWMKDQQATGDKVCILRKGWIVTNRVTGTPAAGNIAVLDASGTVRGVAVGTASTATAPHVGRFISAKDEDGYAKVYVDL